MLRPALVAIATAGTAVAAPLQKDAAVIFASTIDFSHGFLH